MKDTVKYGIISTAQIANRYIKALKLAQNSEVCCVGSRDFSRAKEFANRNGIGKVHESYDAVIDDPSIDAVYVPLINSLHYQYGKKALEAGKHVIIEKPMTLTSIDAIALFDLAREKQLFITEAIKAPFLPVLQKVKQIIDSGILGKLHMMEFKQSYTSNSYASGWHKQKEAGGGVLYGNEAYFMTIAEMMAGRIIDYTGLPTYTGFDVEDQFSISLFLENNVLASSLCSTNILMKNGLYLYLEKGHIFVPDYWKSDVAFIYPDDMDQQTVRIPFESEMMYEAKHFSDCILSGKSFSEITTPEKTIRYIRICEDIYRDWSENRRGII